MRRQQKVILLSIFSAIIQTSFLLELFGKDVNPSLIAALCLAGLLIKDLNAAYLAAFLGGLVLDVVSGGLIGLSSLLLSLFVWIYANLQSFYLRGFWASLFFSSISFYLIRIFTVRQFVFNGWILVGSLLTALIGYLFSLILKADHEKTNL